MKDAEASDGRQLFIQEAAWIEQTPVMKKAFLVKKPSVSSFLLQFLSTQLRAETLSVLPSCFLFFFSGGREREHRAAQELHCFVWLSISGRGNVHHHESRYRSIFTDIYMFISLDQSRGSPQRWDTPRPRHVLHRQPCTHAEMCLYIYRHEEGEMSRHL